MASQDPGSEKKHDPLLYTQFDSVIAQLEGHKIMPWPCMPKGKDGGFPKGSDGWFPTVLSPGGRAFESCFWPWVLVTINAVFWTALVQVENGVSPYDDYAGRGSTWYYDQFYKYGLSTTISFLLSFRLNRSILRYWEGMKAWGNIVVHTRSLVSSILVHGRDIPYHRDQAVAWAAAIPIAAKRQLRYFEIEEADLKDILSRDQIIALNDAQNPPLYAAHQIRKNLKPLFDVRPDCNHSPLSPARSSEFRQNEKFLDAIIAQSGTVMNILSTPVPLVYVSHLRTFLIFYLLSMPYLLGYLWGWGTMVIVSMTAALMLGIEASASEVESPFEKGKVNDLDLDNYCLMIMKDIQQMVKRRNEKDGI